MARRFYTLDVFTDRALAGNPLAVVIDADGLDTTAMQAIAREFNLSETVFVFEPRDPVNTAALRIFTPTRELPFAGHPTIGTACLLAHLREPALLAAQDLRIVLEEQIGEVVCVARHRRGAELASYFTLPRLPAKAGDAPTAAALAKTLGIAAGEIGFGHHAPTVFSAGVPYLFVPLASQDAVARTRAFDAPLGDLPLYVYCRDSTSPEAHYHARMLGGFGISEDPATGSAAAAFAGVVMAYEPPGDGDHMLMIEQGVEMGRPSLISLGMVVEGGQLQSATIGGSAVIVSEGKLL